MKYSDLRDFIAGLEGLGELRRVREKVSPVLEMTALSAAICGQLDRRCCSRTPPAMPHPP
jgi:3-polyprenyl-4-hydroxybenzoate decarboxylase